MKNLKILYTLVVLSFSLTHLTGKVAPFNQEAVRGGAPNETLVAAAAAVMGDDLIIELMGSERPSSWVHVFIDLDGDKKSGFNHALGGSSGLGLDLMIEGDIAYRFSGSDSTVWSWRPDTSIVVKKDYEGNILIFKLPASAVKFSDSASVFSVIYDADYVNPRDCLPRDGGVWSITSADDTAAIVNSPSLVSAAVTGLVKKKVRL